MRTPKSRSRRCAVQSGVSQIPPSKSVNEGTSPRVRAIFSFLVHPGKHLQDQPAIGGAPIPLSGKMYDMLSHQFETATSECDIEVAFLPEDGERQCNACRSEVLAVLQHRHIDQARALASRLQSTTTNRSGLGLLFVIVGDVGASHRICISRFPADFGILAEEQQETLRVEFIEKVFMKNAATYKAVVYEGHSFDSGFWAGRATDRQINNNSVAISGYWIKEFLLSDFHTTSATGTRRLALAIKEATDRTDDLQVKEELNAAARLARSLDNQPITVDSFMERFGLTDAARRALLQHLQSPALRGDKFVFSSEEFGKHIRFRSVSISNGAVLTAPVNRFEECFTKRSVNEAQGEYEFTTRGRVTDQRLKSSAR